MSYEAWGEPDGRPTPSKRMGQSLPPCMGGMCGVRGTCARYYDTTIRDPSERLCSHDRYDCWQPLVAGARQVAEHHTLAMIHRIDAGISDRDGDQL